MVTRRKFLKLGMAAGGAALYPFTYSCSQQDAQLSSSLAFDKRPPPPPTPFEFGPFTVDLPLAGIMPETPLSPAPGSPDASLGSDAVFHGIAPEFDPAHPAHSADWNLSALKTYHITLQTGVSEIIPGVETEIFGYNGLAPGPTIRARIGTPIVVRQTNMLDVEVSTHIHGGHNPAHSDGFANYYVLQGKTRDYFYPNIVPRITDGPNAGEFDYSESPSTLWYHDHGMDLTGYNVSRGLAGMYIVTDDREEELIDDNVLPDVDGEFDVPLVIQDQRFNADGSLHYDFLDHNGRLGDVFVVNGKAQPRFKVQRRKYRFRILNGSNARMYHLRLSSGQPFLVIGTDSWLLSEAHELPSFTLGMAQRHDVIIDFSRYTAGTELFLENIMYQTEGRGPEEVDPDKERTPLLKFVVEDGAIANDVSVAPGTLLREHVPIREDEITATRIFDFNRGNGAWQINGQFFNPRRSDAEPLLNGAERWIFKNSSGGWWHPIHAHLEGHQIQSINGEKPPFELSQKVDVSNLGPNEEFEVFMKFRTFTGPFQIHCHNLEHEDMRMMTVFDPREAGEESVLNGVDEPPHDISGIPAGTEEHLFFEEVGDVERLEGRGVGFPDFEPGDPIPKE